MLNYDTILGYKKRIATTKICFFSFFYMDGEMYKELVTKQTNKQTKQIIIYQQQKRKNNNNT